MNILEQLTNLINRLTGKIKTGTTDAIKTNSTSTVITDTNTNDVNVTVNNPVKVPIGYFIDPDRTPLNTINFSVGHKRGWKPVAIRTSNDGTYGLKPSQLVSVGKTLDAAKLEKWAWVFCDKPTNCYSKIQEVKNAGWGLLVDAEPPYNATTKKYEMDAIIPQLENMAKIMGDQGFIICTKPPSWDADQSFDKLMKIVNKSKHNFIAPMTYIDDYKKSISDLKKFYQTLYKNYPGKVVAIIQTYKGDNNPVPKTNTQIQAEIDAIKPYVKGILLFRYGLSNYMVKDVPKTPTPKPSTKSVTQQEVEKSLGVTFNTFTEFYNIIKQSKDYAYYLNGQFTWQQVLDKKFNYLNCVDICQAGVKLANSMKGYTAVPYGIYCTGYGVNHAIFKIKGKEFTKETWIDLAAASSENYNIGYHWCDGAVTKEPGWIPYE